MKMQNALAKVAEKAVIAFAIFFTVATVTFSFLTDHDGFAWFLIVVGIYGAFKGNH